MVRERNIPWPIYNYLEASSYIFHESLFLVRLWKSIFSVCLLSAMVFSGYWLKQHLNQSDLNLQGIFFHWLYLFLLSSPCVLKFLSELLTLLPLVLPFLRLFLAQNFFWNIPILGWGGDTASSCWLSPELNFLEAVSSHPLAFLKLIFQQQPCWEQIIK